ncbi:MAG: hypothetical protein JRD89_00335 [Deltaproteobacteria bacterium]|nr:hypothetical protein [Deltaproteobacteria bacterium]
MSKTITQCLKDAFTNAIAGFAGVLYTARRGEPPTISPQAWEAIQRLCEDFIIEEGLWREIFSFAPSNEITESLPQRLGLSQYMLAPVIVYYHITLDTLPDERDEVFAKLNNTIIRFVTDPNLCYDLSRLLAAATQAIEEVKELEAEDIQHLDAN